MDAHASSMAFATLLSLLRSHARRRAAVKSPVPVKYAGIFGMATKWHSVVCDLGALSSESELVRGVGLVTSLATMYMVFESLKGASVRFSREVMTTVRIPRA